MKHTQYSDFARNYGNIGHVYEKKGKMKQALENLKKVADMAGSSFPPEHAEFVEKENILNVSHKN